MTACDVVTSRRRGGGGGTVLWECGGVGVAGAVAIKLSRDVMTL